MRKKHLMFSAMLLSLTMLSSCALIPEEESVRTAPVVRAYEREAYEMAQVIRGDLVLTEKVSCKYVPVQTENLHFELPGEYIDKLFVEMGDSVVKGQVLGQLQLGTLPERISQTERSVEELKLRLEHLDDTHALDLERFEIENVQTEVEEKQEKLDALEESYLLSRIALEDELYMKKLTLAQLESDLAQRQIRAPFGGTITYARSYEEGDMSVSGERSITLADSTMSLFRAETVNWDRFREGDEYEIVFDETIYPAVVTGEAALGLSEQEKEPGKKAFVYFVLKEPSFELSDGDRGSFELELERREDTLYVDKDAVMAAGDREIVYYQTDEGLKAYKEVRTGLVVGRQIEILDGLNEGEFVIVD